MTGGELITAVINGIKNENKTVSGRINLYSGIVGAVLFYLAVFHSSRMDEAFSKINPYASIAINIGVALLLVIVLLFYFKWCLKGVMQLDKLRLKAELQNRKKK